MPRKAPTLRERVAKHCGLRGYARVPFYVTTDYEPSKLRQVGWQVVLICTDGARIGIDDDEIAQLSDVQADGASS